MEAKYKYVIIAAAFVIAFLLYLFGIRKLTTSQFRKKGYFLTTILIALAFIGCNFSSSGGNDSNSEIMDNIISKSDSKRIKELNKTSEWKAFKTFWKNLDNVKPGKKLNDGSYEPYAKMDNNEKKYKLVDSLRSRNTELKDELSRLVAKELISQLEVDLLSSIITDRINFIYYGNMSMMTRMMPLPGTYEKEKSISSLEYKIDTLLMLERKGKIDTSELKLALSNIDKEIKSLSVLSILKEGNMLRYYSYDYDLGLSEKKKDSISVVDKSILDFDNEYKEFMKKYDAKKADKTQKELHKKYKSVKNSLDEFTDNYSLFCELIRDLVVNV